MTFDFDARPSDVPLVEMVWRTHVERANSFISSAESRWEMVVTTYEGQTTITVRGPETKASIADCPAGAEFLGIVFKLGTYIPKLPINSRLDRNDVTLPQASNHSFWLQGSAWQFPTFGNADTFINRLIQKEILVCDPIVESVLLERPLSLSLRSVQRRFVQATGVSPKTIQQINRAKHATALLIQGVPILDAVYEAGYYDQSHLTNALKHFMGQTPAQIAHTNPLE